MPNQTTKAENPKTSFTALVLASRRGPTEPLALAAGCSHEALMPIGGTPMLDRVLKTLRSVRGIGGLPVVLARLPRADGQQG